MGHKRVLAFSLLYRTLTVEVMQQVAAYVSRKGKRRLVRVYSRYKDRRSVLLTSSRGAVAFKKLRVAQVSSSKL